MINWPILIRFAKFSLVGIMNTGIHYGVFLLLFSLFDIHYLLSSAIGYGCGLINSFILNKHWTFRSVTQRTIREVSLFILVNIISLIVNIGLLKSFTSFSHFSPEIAQIPAIVFSLIVNFLGNHYWTFKMVPQNSEDFSLKQENSQRVTSNG